MNKPIAHPDWYEDGVESSENLWRLDVTDDVQVQLFATVFPDHGNFYTGEFRVFIEHDVRDQTGEKRMRYAGWKHPIPTEGAIKLLAMSLTEAQEALAGPIREVQELPNDTKMVKEFNECAVLGVPMRREKPMLGPPMDKPQRIEVKSHLMYYLDRHEDTELFFNKRGVRVIASHYENGVFRVMVGRDGKSSPLGSGPVDRHQWTLERKPFILPQPDRLLVLASHAVNSVPRHKLQGATIADTYELACLLDDYFRTKYGQMPADVRREALESPPVS